MMKFYWMIINQQLFLYLSDKDYLQNSFSIYFSYEIPCITFFSISLMIPWITLSPPMIPGFLSSKQKDLPGNVGLLDIASALHWTRHYIQNFGGDPNKITTAGQGSGASAAMLLSLSKLTSSKLIHNQAILGTVCFL